MSKVHRIQFALLLSAAILGAQPALAQGDPDNAPIRFGPVALTPTIKLTNIGYDSNVFNEEKGAERSDTTATASPGISGWLRTPRVNLIGRSQVDMYYFRELSALRAIDTDQAGRVEATLNRVTPWASGSLVTTRHRQNLEIDAIAKRRSDDVRVGAAVRLTKKTSVGGFAGRSHVDFESDAVFRGTDLARVLNRTGSIAGGEVRYAATPLTTIALYVQQTRDRFESATERNSDSIRFAPSVEFKPLALISGHATVGLRRVRFLDRAQPDFRGVTASVDLQYTLRARTRIGLLAQRDLEYSYVTEQLDYVLASVGMSLTQRLGDRWEVGGTLGRYHLGYRRALEGATGSAEPPGETVVNSGFSIGYYLGRNRVGFNLDHSGRESDVSIGRGYDRLRVGSSFTYAF
jgi:hypothetical protein